MAGLASAVAGILTERLMLLFSFITLPGALFQLLGRLSPSEASALDLVDWAVVSIFILEYLSKLYLASSRLSYVKSPWNILNLFIILLAFGGALFASPILYSAPLLRTIRAVKLFTESGRSSAELSGQR